MNCLLISGDLMWSSQAATAIKAAGFAVISRPSMSKVEQLECDEQIALIVVDLATNAVDPSAIPAVFSPPDGSAPHVLAVGPHVHTPKLDAARTIGWEVVTRGQFHAKHAEILSRLLDRGP